MEKHLAFLAILILLPFREKIRAEQSLKSNGAVMLAVKGYRLEGDVIRTIHAPSSIECAQNCLNDQRCKSLNYESNSFMMHDKTCELNNSTKSQKSSKLTVDSRFTYYHLQREIEMCRNCRKQQEIYRSCAEVKSKIGTTSDGEYKLNLKYPQCNERIDVYCADMDTENPKEYITLKAGLENNFSMRDYMGSSKQNSAASTKTNFAKIRIDQDLVVARNDVRFATVTWFHLSKVFTSYAEGHDCSGYNCRTTKEGKFKMDLTGTGLRFVTPIDWRHGGYPNCQGVQPNNYAVNKEVISGNCGGSCGGCWAKKLQLALDGC